MNKVLLRFTHHVLRFVCRSYALQFVVARSLRVLPSHCLRGDRGGTGDESPNYKALTIQLRKS